MTRRTQVLFLIFFALFISLIVLIAAIIRDQSAWEMLTTINWPSKYQIEMKLRQNQYAVMTAVGSLIVFLIIWIFFHKSDDFAAVSEKKRWSKIRRKQYNSYADNYKVRLSKIKKARR